MLGYFKGIKKFPIRLIPIAVCATILTAALSFYITMYETNNLRETNAVIEERQQEVKWKIVEGVIEDGYKLARKDAANSALEIEYALRYNYPNLSDLEEQFNKGQYSLEFNNILRDIVLTDRSDLQMNVTLIGTREHLISMFSKTDDHLLSMVDSSEQVSWASLVETNANPRLTEFALNAILNKHSGIIYTANSVSKSGTIEKIPYSSMKELKQIFLTEGIDELRNITLLAPAYITETGDIFGIDDKTFLKSNDNHKMIVIKTVDVGDLLDQNKLYMETVTSALDLVTDSANTQSDRSILQSVLWSFILFLLSMFMIAVYNSEARKGHLHEDNQKTIKGGK